MDGSGNTTGVQYYPHLWLISTWLLRVQWFSKVHTSVDKRRSLLNPEDRQQWWGWNLTGLSFISSASMGTMKILAYYTSCTTQNCDLTLWVSLLHHRVALWHDMASVSIQCGEVMVSVEWWDAWLSKASLKYGWFYSDISKFCCHPQGRSILPFPHTKILMGSQ